MSIEGITKTAEPARRAAMGFVFVCVLLDMVALGIVAPVLPTLIQQFTGDAGSTARYIGVFAATWALMQFFASPVLGALSDRFGRRPVLLLSMLGLGLDYLLMALAPNIAWLFVGRLISGVTAATFSIANAYVADVTPPEQRASRFGLLAVAFGLGFIAGPAIGGLLGGVDPRLPFWGAAVLTLVNAAYGLLVLPESLPKDRRAKFSFRLANPVGSFGLLRSRRGLLPLAGVVFLFYLAHQVLQTVWVPYTIFRYGWSTRTNGLSLALVGVMTIVVQGLIVSRAVRRLGERGVLVVGLGMAVVCYAAFGWAPNTALFLVMIVPFGLMGLTNPGVQGLMSRAVTENEQGRLQGANTGLMAIAGLIGPLIFTELFAQSIGRFRAWAPVGGAFYLAAALAATALVLALIAARPRAPERA